MGPNSAIARRFFDSVQAGDGEGAAAVCAPGMEMKRNGSVELFESVLGAIPIIKKALPDFRYDEVVCVDTENGFVEEHAACVTHPDGRAIKVAAVVVGVVKDGAIVSMHEYLDSAEAALLREAVQAAMAR